MGDESKPETGDAAGTAKDKHEFDPKAFGAELTKQLSESNAAQFKAYTQKLNAEMATLRRHVRGRENDGDQDGGEQDGERRSTREGRREHGPAGLSAADVDERMRQALELGELRGRFSDEEREALADAIEGASIQEQIRIYRGAMALKKPAGTAQNRGRDAPRTGRTSPPATRDDEPARPRTKREYLAMKPEARAKLDELPDFDPDDLPVR